MKKFISTIFSVLAVTLAVFLHTAATPVTENVIFRFDFPDGTHPQSALTADANGNLYGTALYGGGHESYCFPEGCGTAFELSPGPGGSVTKTVLHAFIGTATDGAVPWGRLALDTKGNLFGTTLGGGTNGYGTIFELTPGPNHTWTEAVLFSFPSPYPGQLLTLDSNGNLYGIMSYYGGNGAVFELSRQPNGTWTQAILYAFTGANGDGSNPFGGVIFDSKGNLYGTTESGGAANFGTIFELTPNPKGGWTESILYNFRNLEDGSRPEAPLTIDAKGNLYGSAPAGGSALGGVVFELTQNAGTWTESVLYNFGSAPSDGSNASALVFDAKGNLYGTTEVGGNQCNAPGCGTVFVLTPQKTGPWKETILHQFESAGDGSVSGTGLVVDEAAGRLYGTTFYGGGRFGYGTVFVIQR
jgi:uncharacterized repeat protein (TIGR03803 family)